MIDPGQLRKEIIRPVLKRLDMWSQAAESLMMGTAAQESRLGTYLRQLGSGPAIGIFQVEPATHDDIWDSWLDYRPFLASRVREFRASCAFLNDGANEMAGNLYYATAIARIHYYRVPEALPDADDLDGLANYYKRHFNTHLGKATTDEFIRNYRALVGDA